MDETIKCISCGTQNSADAKVCKKCGGRLEQPLHPSNGLKTDDDEQAQIATESPTGPNTEDDEAVEITELDDSSDAVADETKGDEEEPELYEIEQEPFVHLTADDGEDFNRQGEEDLRLLGEPSREAISGDTEHDASARPRGESWRAIMRFVVGAVRETLGVLGCHIVRLARLCAAMLAAWRIARPRSRLLQALGRDGISTEPPIAELAELRDKFIDLERNMGEKDRAITEAREQEAGDTLSSQVWHFFAKTNKTLGLRLKRRRLRKACAKICRDAGEHLIESGERKDTFGEAWDRVAELDEGIAAASESVIQVKAQRPTPLRDIWKFRRSDGVEPPDSEQ